MFFFSSRRRHTRFDCDWSSDVCSSDLHRRIEARRHTAPREQNPVEAARACESRDEALVVRIVVDPREDRKSTRLNSSHSQISYAVFCLKKKKQNKTITHTSTRNICGRL